MHYVSKQYDRAEQSFLALLDLSPEGYTWAKDFLQDKSRINDLSSKAIMAKVQAAYDQRNPVAP